MTPSLTKIGSFASEIGAEITAYDSDRQMLYVVSGGTTIQIIELSDPTSPQEVFSLDIAQFSVPINGANSIAYKNNLLAVAIAADPITDPGVVALIDLAAVTEISAAGGNILDAVKVFTVGALPDMLTFSPDGSKVLVANEAEAVVVVDDDGAVSVIDPEGSVSIIDVSGEFNTLSQSDVATADFSRFNGKEADLCGDGVRIFPDATTAQDLEPEYIAVSPDGTKAFVTLQENNAIALVDIATATIEAIQPLGLKDYSLSGLDASDQDNAINIQPRPVFGLYMPDAIASFESNGETFYLIANEGDDRGDADADPRGDAIRLKDLADVTSFGRSGLSLDPAFEQQLLADGLLADEALGRLTISSIDGDTDGDGDIDRLVSYGGRSFSVLDSSGSIVFDSGDQIERITAELAPELFNANDGDPEKVDTRSDNKGPEPETVTTGVINGKLYGFVGLERAGGGVLVYDLANPRQPEFVQYVRDNADIAPEGLTFIASEKSPNGQPLLAVANEVSSTIALYQANTDTVTDGTSGGTGGTGGNTGTSLTTTLNNLLAIAGTATTQLKATVIGRAADQIGEILAIVTDDEQGTINGKAPGSDGYLRAALERATVVLSALPSGEFGNLNPERILDVVGGQFLQLATVTGGSLGDLLRGGAGEVSFAIAAANSNGQSAISPTTLANNSLQMGFRLPGSSGYSDITLALTQGDAERPLGSKGQGQSDESEVVDLTGLTAETVTASVEVFREASFNNYVGFYAIEDQQGSVKDPLTGGTLKPSDNGYLQAALANRSELSLTGKNGQMLQYSTELATGKLLSPFLVVDGTLEALLDSNTANNPTVYFNHIGANTDGKDHVRLLGNNVFGFEDLAGGGDMDFDDVIVKMSFA